MPNSRRNKMEITVKVDVSKFLPELLENLPEYSLSVPCTNWRYEACEYRFVDTYDEDRPTFEKGVEDFKKGLQLYVDNYRGKASTLLDPGNWDAEMVDCLVQYTLFGEVVYG